jgi:hypothetical protein
MSSQPNSQLQIDGTSCDREDDVVWFYRHRKVVVPRFEYRMALIVESHTSRDIFHNGTCYFWPAPNLSSRGDPSAVPLLVWMAQCLR